MPSSLDIFGNRRFGQIEADIVAIKADLATILKAVNSPAWLMPPASPAAPAAPGIATTEDTTVNVYLPVIDVGGQIYSLLNQIINASTAISAAIGSETANSAALDQAVAGIAAASAALQAAVSAHNAP